jgi:hypothetical protein
LSEQRRAEATRQPLADGSVDEPNLVEPGLLLFAAYAVRQLAEDASATAGGASAAAATG